MGDLVLVVVLVAVVVLFLAWIVRFATAGRRVDIEEHVAWPADVATTKSEVLARVAPALTAAGYRLEPHSDTYIVFSRSYRPGWVILPCVLLFPIGLIALVVKNNEAISITLGRGDHGTAVAITGTGPESVANTLTAFREAAVAVA